MRLRDGLVVEIRPRHSYPPRRPGGVHRGGQVHARRRPAPHPSTITGARQGIDGGPYRGAPSFETAYLIHLLQDMLEAGVAMRAVETHGGYFEIDTTQDHELCRARMERDRHDRRPQLPRFAGLGGRQACPAPSSSAICSRSRGSSRARAEAMDAAVACVLAPSGVGRSGRGVRRRVAPASYIGVIAEIMHGFVRETRDGLSWHTVVARR